MKMLTEPVQCRTCKKQFTTYKERDTCFWSHNTAISTPVSSTMEQNMTSLRMDYPEVSQDSADKTLGLSLGVGAKSPRLVSISKVKNSFVQHTVSGTRADDRSDKKDYQMKKDSVASVTKQGASSVTKQGSQLSALKAIKVKNRNTSSSYLLPTSLPHVIDPGTLESDRDVNCLSAESSQLKANESYVYDNIAHSTDDRKCYLPKQGSVSADATQLSRLKVRPFAKHEKTDVKSTDFRIPIVVSQNSDIHPTGMEDKVDFCVEAGAKSLKLKENESSVHPKNDPEFDDWLYLLEEGGVELTDIFNMEFDKYAESMCKFRDPILSPIKPSKKSKDDEPVSASTDGKMFENGTTKPLIIFDGKRFDSNSESSRYLTQSEPTLSLSSEDVSLLKSSNSESIVCNIDPDGPCLSDHGDNCEDELFIDMIMYSFQLNLLICIHPDCKRGFTSSQSILAHIKQYHGTMELPKEIKTLLNSKYQKLIPVKPLLKEPPFYYDMTPELKVFDGFVCLDCGFGAPTENTRKAHEHNSFKQSNLQSLHSNKHYFAVIERTTALAKLQSCDQNMIESFVEKKFKISQQSETSNANFNWETKIPRHVRANESAWCADAAVHETIIYQYLYTYNERLPNLSYFPRRFLTICQRQVCNGEDETILKSETTQTLKKAATIRRYARYCSKLVSYVVSMLEYDIDSLNSCDLRQAVQNYVSGMNFDNLHKLLVQLFHIEYSDKTFETEILIFRFMVASHSDENGTLVPASSITSNLAALVRLCHATVVHEFFEMHDPSIDDLKKFLLVERFSPYTVIVQELGYLKNVVEDETKLVNMFWIDDIKWTSIEIAGKIITTDMLAQVVNHLISTCKILLNDLLLGQSIDSKTGRLQDDFSCLALNYSFVTEPANNFRGLLISLIRSFQNNLNHKDCPVVSDGNSFCFDKAKTRSWLATVDKLTEKLFVLLHLTGGLPRRATENENLLICNNELEQRNLFWQNGELLLIHRHHKSEWRSGKTFVARYFPDKVSSLMLQYLTLVRPCYELLYLNILKTEVSTDTLWIKAGEPIVARMFSSIFRKTFKICTGVELNISEYRHIAQAFSEKHCASEKNEIIQLINSALGHTTRTGSLAYGRTQMDIPKCSRDELSDFRKICHKWHALLRIGSSSNSKEHSGVESFSQSTGLSHDCHVSMTQYNTVVLSNDATKKKGIESAHSLSQSTSELAMVKLVMFKMYGFTNFSSIEQANSIMAAISKQDVLSIMPTGSGKSLIYMIPAIIESEKGAVTIVIVPLIALKHQILKECKDKGVSACVWETGDDFCKYASIVVVAAETAGKACFREYCSHMFNVGKLSRIVIDECHTILTWNSFRESMNEIPIVRIVPVPITLLTATLPPDETESLLRIFGGYFTVIRQPTVRWNISYNVHVLEESQVAFKCISLHTEKRSDFNTVVFCMDKESSRVLKGLFEKGGSNVFLFDSAIIGTEREVIMNQIGHSKRAVIIATSAFGMGVDCSNIDQVIHYKGSYGMIDFAQETGRAGRGLNICGKSDFVISYSDLQQINESLRELVTTTDRCRRAILHQYLDGIDVHCLMKTDSNYCDICAAFQTTTSIESNTAELEELPRAKKQKVEVLTVTNVETDVLDKMKGTPQTAIITPNIQSAISQMAVDRIPGAQHAISAVANESMNRRVDVIEKKIDFLIAIAKFGCIACNYLHNQSAPHAISRCRYMTQSMCVRCHQTGHKAADCHFKLNGACLKCYLPGRLQGRHLHQDGKYGQCLYPLTNVLGPLCWIMWNESVGMARSKLTTALDLLGIGQSVRTNAETYFRWFTTPGENGFINGLKLAEIALQQNWIHQSQ